MWWPDTLAVTDDGWLYFTANQLHRLPKFHRGKDLREPPWYLFRVRSGAPAIRLCDARERSLDEQGPEISSAAAATTSLDESSAAP
jgi:hypothetical protein